MNRSFRNIARLLRVARILARHDALFLLEKLEVAPAVTFIAKLLARRNVPGRPGQRLARAFTEAGPSFIKLGQALSTRSDLLGEELTTDLSDLQDRLAPFSGLEARAVIESELGESMEDLFDTFDDTAVAAASIAQVHFAITADGDEVAVKVLRPGIEDAFNADVDMFLWVAELMEATRPEWRRLKPVESVRTLANTVELEMDLRFEAAAAQELAENFEGDNSFRVPAVHWPITAKRVMATERVSGVALDDREAVIAAGLNPEEVLTGAASAFFNQVFRDGFFHGDMHPGNVFVANDGAILPVDFGIMGRLDRSSRLWIGEMLLAFLTRDYRRAAEIHFEAGWIPADQSVDTFTQACRSIAEPILDKPQNEISIARLLGQLFQITELFHMETQPQLLLLQKTMLVAEGTGRALAPDANMWLLVRPLIEEWVILNMGPEAKIMSAVQELKSMLVRLPRAIEGLEKGAEMMADGRIRLHPDTILALRGGRRRPSNAMSALWVGAAIGVFALIWVFH